jgi:hypothetical protein
MRAVERVAWADKIDIPSQIWAISAVLAIFGLEAPAMRRQNNITDEI